MLAPAALPGVPLPAPRQGRAGLEPNHTKTCARAILSSCEPSLGQRQLLLRLLWLRLTRGPIPEGSPGVPGVLSLQPCGEGMETGWAAFPTAWLGLRGSGSITSKSG